MIKNQDDLDSFSFPLFALKKESDLGKTHDFYVIPVLLLQIPVVLNAVGGILVGLVTSYAGGVRKASVH